VFVRSLCPLIGTWYCDRMISKKERLTRAEFEQYRTHSRRFEKHTDVLRVVMVDDDAMKSFIQVSVVVSKKTIKSAVIRHLIKRRVYAWFRTHRNQLVEHRVYMVHLKKTEISLTYASLNTMLSDMLLTTG